MNSKWIGGLLGLTFGTIASAGGLSFPGFAPPGSRGTEKPNPAIEALRDHTATLHTNLGDLVVALEPDGAPNAVRNFIKLAQKGFYDGSRFYGVFRDRMVLAGDPTGKGTGDVGYTLPHERSSLGHTPGTLAMDTAPPDPKSTFSPRKNSGSRFFINVAAQHHLDRDYTVFGRITEGLEVARRMSQARTISQDGQPAPLEEIVIERITIAKKTEEDRPENPGDQEKK